jgi:lysophospholipase L1-like esterase
MKIPTILTLTALLLSSATQAQPSAAPAAAPPQAPAAPAAPAPTFTLPTQKADVPAQKYDNKTGEVSVGFLAAHERFVAIAKEGSTQLLFLGDSITAGWGGQKAIWDAAFGAYQPANFGIGGDRTQHVLWRITNGELDGIKPKAVVLMIGTNNAGADSAEDIAKGITVIVETIREKQPQAKILLLAVFPRGDKPTGKLNAANTKLVEVNSTIANLDDGKNIFFIDIGTAFPLADGALSAEVMPDFLHLSPVGYQIWADAIGSKLAELMQ